MHFDYITDEQSLAEFAALWQEAEYIAIDTEFSRERSYYPVLSLLQIAVGEKLAVVDLLKLGRPRSIADMLQNPSMIKIIHACGEDVDALFHHFNVLPQNLFDTQMAAAMLGIGPQVGYSHLVDHFYDIHVPKDASRTDWLARPLSDEQLEYAATDVFHLNDIFLRLSTQLKDLNLWDYFLEDSRAIVQKQRYHPIPENMYLKVKQAFRLTRKQLNVLRELAAWRELKARERNLPRGFLLKDNILIEVAKQQPKTPGQLAKINDLQSNEIRRFGHRLIQCVEFAATKDKSQWPEKISRINEIEDSRALVTALKQRAEEQAKSLNIPLYYLANRKLIESFVLKCWFDIDTELWQGWRRSILEAPFQDVARRWL